MKQTTNNKHYLRKQDFLSEYKKSLEHRKPTDKLISMFQLIAQGFYSRFNNPNKCDEQACINFAVSEAWRKWDKLDEAREDKIFNFFTTMIANDMRLHYNQLTRGKKINISIDAIFNNIDK